MARHLDTTPVQSCITTVSFPKSLVELEEMFEKHGDFETDMDQLIGWRSGGERHWSAARWMCPGDILFFYHTLKARTLTKQLYREAVSEFGLRSKRVGAIARSVDVAQRYAGTIFGCGIVTADIQYGGAGGGHFRSRCFAPFSDFHMFTDSLGAKDFQQFVKIGQNTITPLDGKQFSGIQTLLVERNGIPQYVRSAVATGLTFRDISTSNWWEIACASAVRFRDEAQLREFFVNFLLSEVKDPKSPLLCECECFREGVSTGFADYMVRIDSRWFPIEAKLNVALEPLILDQIARYSDIDSFRPTIGTHRGKIFETTRQSSCVIADQNGIYVACAGEFMRCTPSTPLWRRDSIDPEVARHIRAWLCSNAKV